MEVSYRAFDADNHYYETLDAFIRFQDPHMARRGVQILRDGKRVLILVGDKGLHNCPNPTFNPVIVPGCTELWFRGQLPQRMDLKSVMKVEPIHDEYQDREARLRVMDEQGLGAALFFPTQGVGVEECLVDDPEAAAHCLSAFNQWLEQEWGFAFDNRIFAIPMITLADPVAALAELEWLVDRGAKGVLLRPAPVPSVEGPRSFGHPAHDPVWGAIADADIPVFFHLGDSGYLREARAWGSRAVYDPFRPEDPLNKILVSDRAIHDTIASVIAHGVFHRHPKLRVGSIENGSDWVARVGERLRKAANQEPSWFPDDPVEVLRNHVWVSPYYEDDLEKLAETIGVDRILFGSDWPHGEGLASPLQFTNDLTPFSTCQVRKIMRDNVLDLMGSRATMSD